MAQPRSNGSTPANASPVSKYPTASRVQCTGRVAPNHPHVSRFPTFSRISVRQFTTPVPTAHRQATTEPLLTKSFPRRSRATAQHSAGAFPSISLSSLSLTHGSISISIFCGSSSIRSSHPQVRVMLIPSGSSMHVCPPAESQLLETTGFSPCPDPGGVLF